MGTSKPSPKMLTPVVETTRRFIDRVVRWESSASSYVMILGSATLLIVFGLIMVLSSSSVTQLAAGNSAFTEFKSQLKFALIGIVPMLIATRIKVETWKKLAWPMLAVTVVLLILVFVPGIGVDVKGNRNWIRVAGQTFQPSEAAKLTLCIWVAAVLSIKRPLINYWSHAFIPVGPVVGIVLGLVLLGKDMGTGLILVVLVAGMLYVAGLPMRMFGVLLGIGAAMGAILIVNSSYRMDRFRALLGGLPEDSPESWQPIHGRFALASGGFSGVGLGGSREKWSYLPEAHNDFIYAIIGEELGMLGTVGVLVLVGIIGAACIRIIYRHDDIFVKIATAGIFSWIVGQALINISVVVGLLPVLGIPLPMVSSGGSSLVMTMTAIGILLAFAKSADAPEARQRTAAKRAAKTFATKKKPRKTKTVTAKKPKEVVLPKTPTAKTAATAKKAPAAGKTTRKNAVPRQKGVPR